MEEVFKTEEIIKKHMPNSNDSVEASSTKNQQSAIVNGKSTIGNLFRPPYGQITSKQGKILRKLGYRIIMWDVLAFDWKDSVSKETVVQNVITKATSGSIVVFHDSVKASGHLQYALPKVLAYFSEKGFEFRRIPV